MKRVLIVDDEPEIIEVLCTLFSEFMGAKVKTASNGLQALVLLKTQEFDLLVTDFKMPEMSGTVLIEKLRKSEGPNRDMAIIMVTGVVDIGRKFVEKYQNIRFLKKPVDSEEFISTAERLLIDSAKKSA
jgi:CheY-like chemotaxis protein